LPLILYLAKTYPEIVETIIEMKATDIAKMILFLNPGRKDSAAYEKETLYLSANGILAKTSFAPKSKIM